jgi:hypothetical protein
MWQLVAWSANFEPMQLKPTQPVTAIASDGQVVYVVAGGNLTVYDLALQPLGSISLGGPVPPPQSQTSGPPMGAPGGPQHLLRASMHVSGGYAYLIDGTIEPYMSYRVDVRDPQAMQVLLGHDTGSTLPPKLQWLDAGNATWHVERNTHSDGATLRSMTPIELGGHTPGPEIVLHSSTFPTTASDPTAQQSIGYIVHDATTQLPAWAILDNNYTLARVQVEGPALVKSCMTPAAGDLRVLEGDGFVVTWGRQHVRVWATEPVLLVRQDTVLPFPPLGLWIVPAA